MKIIRAAEASLVAMANALPIALLICMGAGIVLVVIATGDYAENASQRSAPIEASR